MIMRIFPSLLFFLITLGAPAKEPAMTNLVCFSPDKKFKLITDRKLKLTISPEGKRRVGEVGMNEPFKVQLIDTANHKILLTFDQNVEGPVQAHWNQNSTHFILEWQGYRYNWERLFIQATGKAKIINLQKAGLEKVIVNDTRPVWKREDQTSKEDPDTSPPFHKKKWLVAPSSWTKKGHLIVEAIELSRDQKMPHPFQQGVTWYMIETRITKDKLQPVHLYDSKNFNHESKPIWSLKKNELSKP